MVLSRFRRFPPIGKLTFTKMESARYLYLLHAAAWVPKNGETIGKAELAFSDGSKTAIPVIAGKDCGNWWSPVFSFENGVIGWTGDNRSSKVGLFVSAFRIPEKGLKSIRFLPGKSVWMIAGVSLGNLRPQRTAERHVTIREDQKWKPIPLPFRFRKGSVMDFSGLNRFHSLRDGALKINDKGHFVLKKDPAKRIRFNGTNFGQFLNVPTHEETDLLVERIAMEGFNSVRLHQFETGSTTGPNRALSISKRTGLTTSTISGPNSGKKGCILRRIFTAPGLSVPATISRSAVPPATRASGKH